MNYRGCVRRLTILVKNTTISKAVIIIIKLFVHKTIVAHSILFSLQAIGGKF